jgi:hypothetical protein
MTQARRGSRSYRFRPGGSWDLEPLQIAVDESGDEGFELAYLQAANHGREQCGGCRRAFGTMNEVVLLVTWVAYGEPIDISIVGYCLECANRHAADITDEEIHGLAS